VYVALHDTTMRSSVADGRIEQPRLADGGPDKLEAVGCPRCSYRTNAKSLVFERFFIRTGHPYKVVGGVRFFLF